MGRRGKAPLAIALLAACAATETQAVITVEVEPSLLPMLQRIEVTPFDVAWNPRAGSTSFSMVGEHAVPLPFSFGAVADGSRELRISLQAYGADVGAAPLLEQRLGLHLEPGQARNIRLLLTPECAARICMCEEDGESPELARCVAPVREPPACLVAEACPSDPCMEASDARCKRVVGAACEGDEQCALGFCSNGVCCNERCLGECRACDVAGSAGSCIDAVPASSPQHCGGCGMACDVSHVEVPHCTGAICDGRCAFGWEDCDGDQRTNGCETELATSAEHCGACNGPRCPYGVCRAGHCVADARGTLDGQLVHEWRPHRMYGLRVSIPDGCSIVGLGLHAVLGNQDPPPHVRMGLYAPSTSTSRDWPGFRVAETSEITLSEGAGRDAASPSVFGGVERRVAAKQLAGGQYWLFFIADGTVRLHSLAATEYWLASSREADYASMQGMPISAEVPFPLEPVNQPLGAVYAIVVCPQ